MKCLETQSKSGPLSQHLKGKGQGLGIAIPQQKTERLRYGRVLLMVQTSGDHQLRLVVYPIICRVLYIPGGAGCLPSTIVLWYFFGMDWVVPLPSMPVTTRIIIFLAGDPYKPSFEHCYWEGGQPKVWKISRAKILLFYWKNIIHGSGLVSLRWTLDAKLFRGTKFQTPKVLEGHWKRPAIFGQRFLLLGRCSLGRCSNDLWLTQIGST